MAFFNLEYWQDGVKGICWIGKLVTYGLLLAKNALLPDLKNKTAATIDSNGKKVRKRSMQTFNCEIHWKKSNTGLRSNPEAIGQDRNSDARDALFAAYFSQGKVLNTMDDYLIIRNQERIVEIQEAIPIHADGVVTEEVNGVLDNTGEHLYAVETDRLLADAERRVEESNLPHVRAAATAASVSHEVDRLRAAESVREADLVLAQQNAAAAQRAAVAQRDADRLRAEESVREAALVLAQQNAAAAQRAAVAQRDADRLRAEESVREAARVLAQQNAAAAQRDAFAEETEQQTVDPVNECGACNWEMEFEKWSTNAGFYGANLVCVAVGCNTTMRECLEAQKVANICSKCKTFGCCQFKCFDHFKMENRVRRAPSKMRE